MGTLDNKLTGSLVRQSDGSEETVSYRLPALRDMDKYAEKLENDAELVEWLCGKEPPWADQFTDESIIDLAERIQESVFPRFAGWCKRQLAKTNRMLPLYRGLRSGSPAPVLSPGGQSAKSMTSASPQSES